MVSRKFDNKIDYEELLDPSVLYNLEKVRLEANKVREIIPILNQHLFTDFCIDKDFFKECGDLNYLYYYDNIIRFLHMEDESFLDYEDGKDMISVLHENILYYYGFLYANKLFEGYLDDKNKFLKKYRALYSGAKLDDFLKYYGADLRNESTIEPTMKILKKYQ